MPFLLFQTRQIRATNGRTDLVHRRGSAGMTSLILLVLVGIGLFAASSYFGWRVPGRQKQTGPRIVSHTVKRGLFVLDTVERGEVESFDNEEVTCEVKASSGNSMRILTVVPEGSFVKKGDLIVQLDSAALEQELVEQKIKCNSEEAEMITAKNTFEAAKISLKEYEQGTFEQEEQESQSAIFIAEETLRRAKEYLAYSERLSARGYVTPQQLDGDRFALEKARTELDAAKTKLRVLQEFTKPKQLLSLKSDIRSAEADWESEKSSYELELNELEELKVEIDKCAILSPLDGQIIYANVASSRSSKEFIVEDGAEVREGQTIVRIPKSGQMQVEAKINESRVTDVSIGLPATVRVSAFGDQELEAEVTHVNEYPEATSWYSSQTKEYKTEIRILEEVEGLRPGLTAEVTIHVSREEDAILVPVQSIYERGRRTWCMRQKPNTTGGSITDQWEAVEVTIKSNNDKYVTIEKGINEDDVLAMNPKSLAEYMDLPEPEQAATSREALGGGRPDGKTGRPGGAGGGRLAGAGGGRPAAASGAAGKSSTSERPSSASSGRPQSGGEKPTGAKRGSGRPGGGRPRGAGS